MLPRDRAVRFTPGVPGTTCRRRRTPLNNEKLTFAAKKAEVKEIAAEGPRKGCTADLYALSACACRFEVTVS